MKKISLIAVLTVLFLPTQPATAGHRKHKKQVTSHELVAVKIDYGPCYGHCPIYSIELNHSGLVTYTGIRFAEDSGVYTRLVSATEAGRILKLVDTYNMDTCQNRYWVRIPDIQVFSFHLYYKTSEKTIQNATFGPNYLKELQAELEQIGEKKRFGDWVKSTAK